METFGAYARQFVGDMERPDVDKITGLSPVIAIEQKTTNKNPRSTVGTITEVYDFLRLLFARAGEAFSYVSGKKMERLSEDQIISKLLTQFENQPVNVLAPLVKGRKGHYRELFEQVRKQGFVKVRIDGELTDLVPKMQVDRYKTHDIEVVIDRLTITEKDRTRLQSSIQQAMKLAKGVIKISNAANQEFFFSRFLMDPESGISYAVFCLKKKTFHSPYSARPNRVGLCYLFQVHSDSVIADPKLSIMRGGLAPLGEYKYNWTFQQLKALAKKYGFSLSTPLKDFSEAHLNIIFEGSP